MEVDKILLIMIIVWDVRVIAIIAKPLTIACNVFLPWYFSMVYAWIHALSFTLLMLLLVPYALPYVPPASTTHTASLVSHHIYTVMLVWLLVQIRPMCMHRLLVCRVSHLACSVWVTFIVWVALVITSTSITIVWGNALVTFGTTHLITHVMLSAHTTSMHLIWHASWIVVGIWWFLCQDIAYYNAMKDIMWIRIGHVLHVQVMTSIVIKDYFKVKCTSWKVMLSPSSSITINLHRYSITIKSLSLLSMQTTNQFNIP